MQTPTQLRNQAYDCELLADTYARNGQLLQASTMRYLAQEKRDAARQLEKVAA